MDSRFEFVSGDTLPAIEGQLTELDGSPFDLTGATVELRLFGKHGDTRVLPGVGVAPLADGRVRVSWPSGFVLAPGLYYGRFKTVSPAGTRTFPSGSASPIRVVVAPND